MNFFTWLWEMITGEYYEGAPSPSTPSEVPDDQGVGLSAAPDDTRIPPGATFVVAPSAGGATRRPASSTRLTAQRFTLKLKCAPYISIRSKDSNITKFLNALGYSLKDIEWQSPVNLTKYELPKYVEGEDARVFEFRLYKVIPGATGGADPVEFFRKYVDYDAPYPAWDLLHTVAKKDNYPIVAQGPVSKDDPYTLELPPGYYVLTTAEKSQKFPEFSKWWVIWGDIENPRISTWQAFKDFWNGEKLTQIHRFRYVESWDSEQWCRLLHLDANEGYTWHPFRNLVFQDWSKVPPSWDEKIAQWAEEKAEGLWTTFKGIFGQ